ncbi:hypothetical protein [Saccharicrinis aurantiacus]|uniref:hypothetical protein n=1 Tax=Saccharicrinis aurantiacus TaxID=1849719 RepID=UPI00248FD5D8|nr:hypothetical protein [Saccharicrinis aurantiacus]
MRLLLFIAIIAIPFVNQAQTNVYGTTSIELIFSSADVNMDIGGEDIDVRSPMRFTAWFHYAQYLNFDFTNNIGLYTGGAIRNVGFITNDADYDIEKRVHRSYSLGVPLAIKLGVFDKRFFIYGGAEYEWMFHYKEKYWEAGQKYKTSEWFSDKVNTFVPSVFVGIQLPKGANLQFKYYLEDFLNSDYNRGSVDFSNYNKTRMFYVSLGFQLRTIHFKKVFEEDIYRGQVQAMR